LDTNSIILGLTSGALIVVVVVWLLARKGLDWWGPQLRQLPVHRLKYLLAARFFRMASVAFMLDAGLGGGGLSRMLVVALSLPFAAIGPLVLLLRRLPPGKRFLIFLPIVWGLLAVVLFLRPHDVPSAATAAAAYRFDALVIFATMLVSAFLTTKYINTEGARTLRSRTATTQDWREGLRRWPQCFWAALGAVVIHYSISAALWLATAMSGVCSAALFRSVRASDRL
jgi:hypothetical protein